MCDPNVFFLKYDSLRGHLRVVHSIRKLTSDDLSAYESYPNSRLHMVRSTSTTSSAGGSTSTENAGTPFQTHQDTDFIVDQLSQRVINLVLDGVFLNLCDRLIHSN